MPDPAARLREIIAKLAMVEPYNEPAITVFDEVMAELGDLADELDAAAASSLADELIEQEKRR